MELASCIGRSMANFTLCCFGSVILFSVGGSYSFECDIFPAHRVVATGYKVVNTLNCSTTRATYSFFVEEEFQELGTKITCKSGDTGEVHSSFDPLGPVKLKMGFVDYSSLQPSLPADKLPEGSECQLYGCTLSSDDSTYWMFEGEKCNISYPDCVSWGEWSDCYSNEHCGIGWMNRTRKATRPWSFCESDALAEYKKCNPCSSFLHQDVQIIATSVVLLTLFVLLLCPLTWIGLKCYMSRHYKGMLHCINVSENEMFDADSELVKVGTDSPMATTVAMYTSLNSLDLIEPLGKSSDEMDFIDTRNTYNQKPCIDGVINEDNGSEEFCLQLQVTECIKFPTPIQENSVQQNHVDSITTTNHKTVLTSINADGYVHTQLLSCTEL